MKAYAVFDGGGVKGAALAGALSATQRSNIEIAGYGGTSAGSIVALLASVGYSGDELEDVMVKRLSLAKLATEIGPRLAELNQIKEKLSNAGFFLGFRLRSHRKLLATLSEKLGFSDGNAISESLYDLVKAKVKNLDQRFTFVDLIQRGFPVLKIVASDLGRCAPVVFSHCDENLPVLDAVRASMSYPFAFQPMRLGSRTLVDGGLCSNLPVFVFQKERDEDRLPLIAFDLVSDSAFDYGAYGLSEFAARLIETALESSDVLLRSVLSGIHHVRIRIPADISALDFNLSEARLHELFTRGAKDAYEYIHQELIQWQQADNEIQLLQAAYAPAEDVEFVLQQFALHSERDTSLQAVRANVMLPTSHKTRKVVYQFNMTHDGDQDLELSLDGGCSGKCWITQEPTLADLADAAHGDHHLAWKMTGAQQAKVRKDRKSMISIPIFAPESDTILLGVLSADSATAIEPEDVAELGKVFAIGRRWAIVLTAVLG